MEDKDFLQAMREYMEHVEVIMENDRGYSRSLKELIADNAMPKLYAEVMRRLDA